MNTEPLPTGTLGSVPTPPTLLRRARSAQGPHAAPPTSAGGIHTLAWPSARAGWPCEAFRPELLSALSVSVVNPSRLNANRYDTPEALSPLGMDVSVCTQELLLEGRPVQAAGGLGAFGSPQAEDFLLVPIDDGLPDLQ